MLRNDIRPDRAFELDGYWWVPDETERRAGHLNFAPEAGAQVRLLDWYSSGLAGKEGSGGPFPFEPPERVDVIHGETITGVPCTLFDAICQHWEMSLEHSSERWSSNSLVHGAHLMARDELLFDRAVVQIRGLESWLTQSAPGRQGMITGLDGRNEEASVVADLPGAHLTLRVAPVERIERGEHFRNRVASVQAHLDEPTSLPDFRERYLAPLLDLLVLATREAVVVERLVAYLPLTEPTIPGPPFPPGKVITGHRPSVEIVERVRSEWPTERRHAYERMLFGLATLHEGPGQLIARWFENHGRLGEAGSLFFGTLDGPKQYLSSELLSFLAYAEAYHRTEFDSPPLREELHEELVGRMLATLDDGEQRNIYGNALKHANSTSQRWRVEALVVRAAEAIPELDALRTRLARAVVHTRNYFIHWGTPTNHVLDREELLDSVRRLVLVLQVNLMLDLGLPTETVAACVRRSYAGDRILGPQG